MTEYDDIIAEDAKALTALYENWNQPPAELVGKLPKAGMQLDYLGHAEVTRALLESDPFWFWEPMGVNEDGLPALDPISGGLWIKLTVHGVTRPGYGDSNADPKQMISDAIRNAAMRFGVALSLWSKQEWTDVGAHSSQPGIVRTPKANDPAPRTTHPGGSSTPRQTAKPTVEVLLDAFEGSTIENFDDQSPFEDSASTASSPTGGTEPPPQPAPVGTITEPQVKLVSTMLTNLGITNADDRHVLLGNLLGLDEPTHLKSLEKKQASTVIDSLKTLTANDFVEVGGSIRLA
jgi:hypothetical protein